MISVLTCGRAVFRRTEFILRQNRDTVETGMPEAGLGLAGICTSTSMLVLARTRNPAAAPCTLGLFYKVFHREKVELNESFHVI